MNTKAAHLNGNMFAAIDTETTGADPSRHEIVEIAIIPLTSEYDVSRHLPIFHVVIEPDFPENIDIEASRKVPILQKYYKDKLTSNKDKIVKLKLNGIRPNIAAELLVDWFEQKICLPPGKRIIPIGCNYAFDRMMMQTWLGNKTYELIFSDLYRDVQVVANYLNDSAYANRKPEYPFQKVNLQYLCSTLNIERRGKAHTALDDAYVTAQIYKAQLYRLM